MAHLVSRAISKSAMWMFEARPITLCCRSRRTLPALAFRSKKLLAATWSAPAVATVHKDAEGAWVEVTHRAQRPRELHLHEIPGVVHTR